MVYLFRNHSGEVRTIRAELQLHLNNIADGSTDSPKERMHAIYKSHQERASTHRSFITRAVSKLSFLSGMVSQKFYSIPYYLYSLCHAPVSDDLCQDSDFNNTVCHDNLAIPREKMPQVPDEVRSAYLQVKEAQGFHVVRESIPARSLTPIQGELNRRKVDALVDAYASEQFNPCEEPNLVVQERERKYVVDGHQRYAACYQVGGDQQTYIIENDTADNVLNELNHFPGVWQANLDDDSAKAH